MVSAAGNAGERLPSGIVRLTDRFKDIHLPPRPLLSSPRGEFS